MIDITAFAPLLLRRPEMRAFSRLSHTFSFSYCGGYVGQGKRPLQTNFISAVLGVFVKVRHDAL